MQLFGAIYFLAINNFMGNFFNSVLVFQAERPVFLREYSNRMYGVFSYYIAKSIMDFPVLVLTNVIGVLITYFIVNFERTPQQFFLHFLSLLMNNMTAQAIGTFLSSIFESQLGAT